MRGIDLKTSIRLFGVRIAIPFWFKWSFVDPVQMFVWLNITHKPYCLYHGYVGCNSKCTEQKLFKKQDILKYWGETHKEIDKVITGKNGMCAYCGEFKGRVIIPDPNNGLSSWSVCGTCDKVIKAQHKLSMGHILKNDKLLNEAKEELKFLSEESFTPVMSVVIKKKGELDENI